MLWLRWKHNGFPLNIKIGKALEVPGVSKGTIDNQTTLASIGEYLTFHNASLCLSLYLLVSNVIVMLISVQSDSDGEYTNTNTHRDTHTH